MRTVANCNSYQPAGCPAQREPDFARGFTEHLIEYALGRPFGFIDEDLAKEVIASAKNQKYAVREFIQSLVLSQTFRKK